MPAATLARRRVPPRLADGPLRADHATSAGRLGGGLAWTKGNATDVVGTLVCGVASRQLVMPTPSGTDPCLWLECDDPNGVLECDVTVTAVVAIIGLLVRRVTANTYLEVVLNQSADTVAVLKSLAGVRSTPASTALATVAGQVVRLRVVMTPATIKVFADGVLKLSYSDLDCQRGTKHGVCTSAAGGGTWANWSFTPAGSAP